VTATAVLTAGPFAELVLRLRVAAGLSQRELARRSGLSERAVRKDTAAGVDHAGQPGHAGPRQPSSTR
jgi:hypothetical protein